MASNYVLDIAQDHEWLYVLTQEELLKVSKDGSGTTVLLAQEKTPGWFQGKQRIAVHDGTLYWAKGNVGAIWRIPAGGTPEPFIDGLQGTDAASGLVVVGSLLYFLRDGHANVVDLSTNGGYRELAETSRFVADPDGCYVVQFEDKATYELTLSGVNMSEGRSFSTRLPPYSDQKTLFANEGFIYYLVDSESNLTLQRRATFGQRDELVASSALLSDEMNLAADGDDVYWTLDDGSLYHVSIGQGTAGALMSRQLPFDFDDYDGFLLLDNDYVYWQAPIDSTPHDDNAPLPILRSCRAGRGL